MGGRIWESGVGILIQKATYNTIVNNEVGDFMYTGISAGWDWYVLHIEKAKPFSGITFLILEVRQTI
jgi:hypothetical protein